MAVVWSFWFVTLSCILVGTVNSSNSNVTVIEFCSCWSVQSTAVQGDSCTVVLDFGNCWLASNATPTPGVDVISNADLVKFGLTVDNSVSQELNCTVDNICSLAFGISTLAAGKRYTVTIQPQCDTCNICNGKVTEFSKAIPTTTEPPSTTKRYKPLPHKYLFPTLLIGAIVCVITAFIFVIRRWRQRIHHARKERAAVAASFANLQSETDNNNGRGDNPSPPPRYGTTEQYNGGAHYLTINEKHGIVNDGFDYKN
ncbi:uncharacterized protein LOC117330548 [Pecten maximus]|uniref:uncharacterized protein LOC117330548 n=1 Tax=Pecten maximus TaxID=6579 RepID=UPI00145901E3|nr:uncharacterized protein LOC117330548 [Pecten maximus]XP_033744830.1 uncharacterized protein LOC117330548 [Pecten maximus]XP_033744832.1 uncharacterized protein LOC117330548 [Pecten maximus]